MLKQSTPYKGDYSFYYLAFTYETVSNGTSPELSARAIGIARDTRVPCGITDVKKSRPASIVKQTNTSLA